MTSFVQIATLVILVSYSLVIISPFVGLAIWGLVMAVAIYPVFLKVTGMLGGRSKLVATLFVVVGLAGGRREDHDGGVAPTGAMHLRSGACAWARGRSRPA